VNFKKRLEECLSKRRPVSGKTQAYRWVDGELAGLSVDLFGDVGVLSEYRAVDATEESALADALVETASLRALYVKRRPKEARKAAREKAEWVAPVEPLRGAAVPSLTIVEEGRRFEIRPANGLSVGLYLDARDARGFVQKHAQGRRVLNLFSYTCGFGLAAALGGATRVANLDLSRRVLDWGQNNYALNGLDVAERDFISGDALEWLPRLAKKEERFELVVLDPPSFATTKTSRFSAQADYGKVAQACLPLIAPGGWLLACCNLEEWNVDHFAHVLETALKSRTVRRVAQFGASAADFKQPSALKVEVLEL
jgi:23S rRNA (cytosine1962-C5)-methyltransferase